MPDDLGRNEWYTQDPKVFRKKLWDWLFDNPKGGELGHFIVKFTRRCSLQFRRGRLSKVMGSSVARSVVVVLIISSAGVFIKRHEQKSVAEKVFDNLESIALGSAGVIFLLETQDRRKRDHYEAWQVINLARGQTGSGGRIQALQDLVQDGVDLRGLAVPKVELSYINLSSAKLIEANFENAKLGNANLAGANLERANLQGAELGGANLQKAYLRETDLRKAELHQTKFQEADLGAAKLQGIQGEMVHFERANLRGARLKGANLRNAYLWKSCLAKADLREANLENAHLQNANLEGANLQSANLEGVNLQEANLQGTNLQGAKLQQTDLKGTNLAGANLAGADLAGAKNTTQTQLAQAKLCLTRLPDGIALESNHDCQKLGIDPETGELLRNESD